MFLSMNWIGDFVDLSGFDKVQLIKNFTLSTAEVEDIIIKGEDTKGVIVAEIVSVENHPNSKKLHLLKVNTGSEIVDIVCGAPNVRVGLKVALATAGGSVCGHPIAPATIAGFTSYGMCCSEAELGISDDHSGIWELDESLPLGADIKSIYAIDDIIFEVDNKSLTNRPDLWSHYGMAREFATLTGRELKLPECDELSAYSGLPEVAIDVKATELVWRYSAIKVENILRRVSPVNMRIRLYYCGSRAINFLADLTNYVMMELGQPMHAFDNAVVDKIEVQTFPAGTKFETLDGVVRDIDENMLMITSDDKPVAVAGVMGGEASKIEDSTTSLLLESATFDGVSVRKTTTRLGLRTDASMRYEKMLDPELCSLATARLLYLLKKYDSGCRVSSSFTDAYVKHYEKITLSFDKKYVDRYTGIDISNEQIVKTLTALGFGVTQSGDNFTVTVPSWRATKDVTIKADIIEEITRIYGYDNFEIFTSQSPLLPVRTEVLKSHEDRMRDILVKEHAMHEVHSYIWSDAARNRELGIKTVESVRIINASNPDNSYLRTTMLPTLLSFAADNKSYADSFSIFEIGHTVDAELDAARANYCTERKKLGAVLFSKTESEEALFTKATDAVCDLVDEILHKNVSFAPSSSFADYCHPENVFDIIVCDSVIGYLSVAHPTVCENIDKKCAVAFFEIETESFAKVEAGTTVYAEPSKFPGVEIDMTFNTGRERIPFDKALAAATEAADGMLKSCYLQDVYEKDSGYAITLRFTFEAQDRTLSKGELAPVTEKIATALAALGMSV